MSADLVNSLEGKNFKVDLYFRYVSSLELRRITELKQ